MSLFQFTGHKFIHFAYIWAFWKHTQNCNYPFQYFVQFMVWNRNESIIVCLCSSSEQGARFTRTHARGRGARSFASAPVIQARSLPRTRALFSLRHVSVMIIYQASDRKRIASTALTDLLRNIPINNNRISSNKRPSFDKRPFLNKRPHISLSSINSRDTRKSCFYCHFIYNILSFNHHGITTGE